MAKSFGLRIDRRFKRLLEKLAQDAKSKKYLNDLSGYNQYKDFYEKKRAPLLTMRKMLEQLPFKNKKQEDFITLVTNCLDTMIVENDAGLRSQEPIMETSTEVHFRLLNERTEKINAAKDYLISYNNYIKFDDAFFVELIEDWFNSGKLL